MKKNTPFAFAKKDITNTLIRGEECPFFQKFVKEPYVEKYTKCDKCKLLEECKEEGRLIEVTTEQDSSQHYIMGCGYPCKE